ncbi:hypothetical protein ACOI1H_03955 [Loktanella sp. DJP18]|uniref:hypothetical protein n=1 Tax=Loktanella sp. DJP18 TaxID=3409788 RepID=UPI003BB58204
MRRWAIFAPLAALIVLTGYLGLRLGQPLGDTEIIERAAARYLAEVGDGAARTDCAATAHPQARMIVVCHHADGRTFSYVMGDRGEVFERSGPQA